MKQFMDDNFLLQTPTAVTLYHKYAKAMPIIDYHCHINPADIAQNKTYECITEVWLSGDHYKWRAMRDCGISESNITASVINNPYSVFKSYAKILPKLCGNPLYHWSYLELKRYFGIETELNEASAKQIYEKCNSRLHESDMSVRGIIKQSNVKLICTTDDPIDTLEYHKQIAQDKTCQVKVLPAFRPDKAMNADKAGYSEYIAMLGKACGFEIKNYDDLIKALYQRIDFFNRNGCRTCDHALDSCVYSPATKSELDSIVLAALIAPVSAENAAKLKTYLLIDLSKKYSEYNWVMQIHFGCIRNNSEKMFNMLGPDTGFDAVCGQTNTHKLAPLLSIMEKENHLPKMILYSLNQHDNEAIATIAGCFHNDGTPGKIQLGSAWWFNDNKSGMEKQLCDLANLGALGEFVGMLTDSRSFLSYTRHEYFRRILCNLIGRWVENGECFNNMEALGTLVQNICYNNTVKLFGFDL